MPMPPGDGAWRRRAARWRHQAARVDRMDRDVRAERGVDRGAQLRLVVDAVQPQAAREVDQRLLLGQRPQHRDRRLQRRQLAIGVEDVELGVVLTERRCPGRACPGCRRRPSRRRRSELQNDLRSGAVVGEILLHPHGAALERHDRHQIGRRSICVSMNFCALRVRAHLIGGRHRRQIEVQHQQPAIPVADVAAGGEEICVGAADCRRLAPAAAQRARGVRQRRSASCASGAASRWNSTKVIACGSPSSVTEEVLGREALDGLAVLVLDGDGLDDEAGAASKRRVCAGLVRGGGPRQRAHGCDNRDTTSSKRRSGSRQNLIRRLVCTLRIGFGTIRQAELRAADDRVHAGVGHAIQDVRGVEAPFEVETGFPRATSAPDPAFNANCDGPVIEFRPALPHCPAAGGAIRRRIQVIAGRRRVDVGRRCSRRESSPMTPVPAQRRQIDRRERQAASGRELAGDRPSL